MHRLQDRRVVTVEVRCARLGQPHVTVREPEVWGVISRYVIRYQQSLCAAVRVSAYCVREQRQARAEFALMQVQVLGRLHRHHRRGLVRD